MTLTKNFSEKSIQELVMFFEQGLLNLEPGFQRKSVWREADRKKLIESIFAGYPIPSIFLYEQSRDGKVIYDVIDGKQRIESILMFTRTGRFRHKAFDCRLDLGMEEQKYSWTKIMKHSEEKARLFKSYQIQTVLISGDFSDIVNVFVRINSTGKPLTSGERRNARFYHSKFLNIAERISKKYVPKFLDYKILTVHEIERMKDTELVSELLMSIHNGGPINKKWALDSAIGNKSFSATDLSKISREFEQTFKLVLRIFPNLPSIRFHKLVDFYTLFMLVWKYNKNKFILTDRKRNEMAQRMLARFSTGVDSLRDSLRQVKPPKNINESYQRYLLTVQSNTDSLPSRHGRETIINDLLESLFERKDEKRIFSTEQRRILWNTDVKQICKSCKRQLHWNDFTVDHILAHTRGGKTLLSNAQILCRSCNSRKKDR